MPRTCTICTHSDREAIDAALVSGDAYRSIAQHFATSPDAMWRHRNDHLPTHLAKANDAETASQAGDLLAKVATIEAEAKRIARKAEDAGDLRTAMSGIRELARLVELLAKLRGELNENQTVNVFLLPEWQQARTLIISALAPYPQARIAIAHALERIPHANGHGA